MKDHKVKNSTCGFGGDLVGYLYDEIGSTEKRIVEQHIADCDSCSSEIAGVSYARQSVGDWFSQEFAGLPTPKFEFDPERENEEMSVWSLWRMLSGMRFRVPILAAVSALVIVGSLLLFRSTAVDTELASLPVAAVTTPDESFNSELNESAPDSVQPAQRANTAAVASDPDLSRRPARVTARSDASDKRAEQKPKPRETGPGERYRRTFPSDRSVAEGIQIKPSLNGFEEKEDDTLRLEDIFSEIDAS